MNNVPELDRRILIRTSAWAVPVVAVAVAAPVAAATVQQLVRLSSAPNPVQASRSGTYHQANSTLTLTNLGPEAVSGAITLLTSTAGPIGFTGFRGTPGWGHTQGWTGLIYSGGLAPGASTSIDVYYAADTSEPAVTTVTWAVNDGATGDPCAVTILP